LYVHGEEWFADQDRAQYLKFLQKVDRKLLLSSEGHPDIKCEIQMSLWADARSNLRDILLVISKDEYAQMAKRVAYTIQPVNSKANYQWKVNAGLTVTREMSLEEKLDALQERFD